MQSVIRRYESDYQMQRLRIYFNEICYRLLAAAVH